MANCRGQIAEGRLEGIDNDPNPKSAICHLPSAIPLISPAKQSS
jgi:hypothetical protein